MKERPILFRGEMVRAIIQGRKTQTRRIVKPQPLPEAASVAHTSIDKAAGAWRFTARDASGRALGWPMKTGELDMRDLKCPYGATGDGLWVRETWSDSALSVYPCPPCWYRADFSKYDDPARREHIAKCRGNRADCFACVAETKGPFQWRPSILMPRKHSRITLQLESVRVERLQNISEEDALAEGLVREQDGADNDPFRYRYGLPGNLTNRTAYAAFSRLWDSVNGEGAWQVNPWVWVLGFKRVESSARAA